MAQLRPSPKRPSRLLGVQAASAAAQVSGAGQLAALLTLVGPTRAADAYVTLFSASQLTLGILVVGTLQPVALGRPDFAGWRRWAGVAAGANVVVVFAAAAYLDAIGYPYELVWPIAWIIAFAGALAACNNVFAVRRALRGSPAWAAGLTVAPNVLATLALIPAHDQRVNAMCFGLLAGHAAVGWRLLRTESRREALQPLPRTPPPHAAGAATVLGLIGSSTVGAIGPFGLQAATATFSAGQATLIAVFSRLSAGMVSVGVTAYISTVTDWEQRDDRPLRSLSRGAAWLGATISMVWLCGAIIGAPALVQAGAAGLVWTLASASQAATQRALSLRGRYRAFRSAGWATLVLYTAGAVVLIHDLSDAAGYFGVLALIASLAAAIFARSAGWRDVSRHNAVALVGALAVLGSRLV